MSAETLDVPADIFRQPYGPVISMLFDASPTVLAGCAQQQFDDRFPTRCFISSR